MKDIKEYIKNKETKIDLLKKYGIKVTHFLTNEECKVVAATMLKDENYIDRESTLCGALLALCTDVTDNELDTLEINDVVESGLYKDLKLTIDCTRITECVKMAESTELAFTKLLNSVTKSLEGLTNSVEKTLETLSNSKVFKDEKFINGVISKLSDMVNKNEEKVE